MLKKFLELSDDQIKEFFEHLRNLAICGAFFATSEWQLAQIDRLNSGLGIFNALIFGLLITVGVWLLLIVLLQAFRKIKGYGLKGAKLGLACSVYGLVVVSLMISIFVH